MESDKKGISGETSEEKEKKSSKWKDWMDCIKIFVVVLVVFLLLSNFVYVNAYIPSGSMENTIMTGDRVFGNRLAYKSSDPERFDIVIFKYPDDPSRLFVKRIIGLPGETVEIKDGKVYIDGSDEPLDDSFIKEETYGNYGPYEVPENCYFMLGDNRNNSNDSRKWKNTYVERDAILAKAVLRYWPLNKFGFVE